MTAVAEADAGIELTLNLSRATVYTGLVDVKTAMDERKAPTEGRMAVMPPTIFGELLKDPDVKAETDIEVTGSVRKVAGFEVVVDDIEFMNQRGGQDGGFQGQGSGYQQNSGYQQSGYQQNSGYQGSGYQQPSYQQPSYQQASAPSFSAPSYAAPAPTATAPVATPPSSDVYDEDIPF